MGASKVFFNKKNCDLVDILPIEMKGKLLQAIEIQIDHRQNEPSSSIIPKTVTFANMGRNKKRWTHLEPWTRTRHHPKRKTTNNHP